MTGRKYVARLIDLVLLVALAIAPLALSIAYLPHLMEAPAGQPPTMLMLFGFVWMAATLFLYMPIFESSSLAASPGKLIMGLRVLKPNGARMDFGQAMMRTLYGPLFLYMFVLKRWELSGRAEIIRR